MVLSHKAKQYLLAALKLLILFGLGAFIYVRLKNTPEGVFNLLQEQLTTHLFNWVVFVIIGIAASFANWGLEAKKWQLLVNSKYSLAYLSSWKQTYGAFTASVLTPQRVGEYGAKALYFPKEARKSILWLTFLGNAAQLLITSLFGILALVSLIFRFDLSLNTFNLILAGVVLLFFGLLAYLFREQELLIQGLSIKKVMGKFKETSRLLLLKICLLSLLRYLVFGGLFYLSLLLLGVQIETIDLAVLIAAYYLLNSISPSLFLLDIVVKSGIAIWLFSLAQVPEVITIAAVILNWIFNFVIPAITGSYFVLKFKPLAP